jgi:hypothetical protein
MTKTGYDLIGREALPDGFWQTTDEDRETTTCLEQLSHSLYRSGFCWLVWDKDQQALYEQRDRDLCSVMKVVEHDVIQGKATPCGDLRRRGALPVFFSVSQFWQILSRHPQQVSLPNSVAVEPALSSAP